MCSLAFASCQVPASPYKVEDMSQEEFFFFFLSGGHAGGSLSTTEMRVLTSRPRVTPTMWCCLSQGQDLLGAQGLRVRRASSLRKDLTGT